MGKRGTVEVDWILSIVIFLIYLALFFLYLTPFAKEQPEASNLLLANLESRIRENATWHVQRVPLFIHSNISGTEPLIAPFSLTLENISFADNTSFYRQENKLIFKEPLNTGPNIKWVVSSDEAYPQEPVLTDLGATPSGVVIDSQRFRAEFDGLPTSVLHFEKQRFSAFNISLDSGVISRESAAKESNFSGLAAKYKLSADTVNHTTFVIGDFPRLFNYVVPSQALESHNFTVSVTLHNYTHYFIDNALSGQLNFTQKSCNSKTSGYIDFYDALGGVSFITDEAASIYFCTGNHSIGLTISMDLSAEKNYNIIFHSGDYNKTLKYVAPYTIKTGLIENLSGVSIALMNELNTSDYANLKNAWNYPSQRDFSFQLLNSTALINVTTQPLINYSPKSPGTVNVFVREFDELVLDKYGNKVKHKLRVKGW